MNTPPKSPTDDKDLQRRQLDMNKKDENYNKLKMEFDGMKQMVQGNL